MCDTCKILQVIIIVLIIFLIYTVYRSENEVNISPGVYTSGASLRDYGTVFTSSDQGKSNPMQQPY